MTPRFDKLASRAVVLRRENVDTDQIIPARFLKVTDKQGLKEGLFCDWRLNADGSPKPDFPLHRPEARGAQILVAGDNFGCGSSREHAPWALTAWGFKVVVSTSFADIFKNNALKNGLLPVALPAEAHARLLAQLEANRTAEVAVDLAAQTLKLPDGSTAAFPVDSFSKHCLLNGIDELGYLLSFRTEIESYEARRREQDR